MAKINSDKHGIYFIYNGCVWRPIIPEKEQSIAQARRMFPDNSKSLIGEAAKPKGIEGFFIHLVINGMDYLWYNHGTKRIGFKSESVYRDFAQEDIKINSLIASGLSIKEAYSIFWKTLI
jgi:hypothetical protein